MGTDVWTKQVWYLGRRVVTDEADEMGRNWGIWILSFWKLLRVYTRGVAWLHQNFEYLMAEGWRELETTDSRTDLGLRVAAQANHARDRNFKSTSGNRHWGRVWRVFWGQWARAVVAATLEGKCGFTLTPISGWGYSVMPCTEGMKRKSTCWGKGNALQLEYANPEGSWRLPGRNAKEASRVRVQAQEDRRGPRSREL